MSRTAELFPDPCVLCGSETTPTQMQLVEWLEPVEGQIWTTLPRCRDRAACRARVELELGEPWPIRDRTPAPERPVVEKPAADEPAERSPWLVGA